MVSTRNRVWVKQVEFQRYSLLRFRQAVAETMSLISAEGDRLCERVSFPPVSCSVTCAAVIASYWPVSLSPVTPTLQCPLRSDPAP